MKKIPVSFFALIFALVAVFCAVSIANNNKKAEAAVITEEWFTGEIPSWKYGTATMPSESTDVSTTSPSTWYSSTWYDESTGTTYPHSTTTYPHSTTTYPHSTTTTRNYSSTSSTATTYNYDMTTPTTTWYYSTTTTPQVACNNYEPQTVVTTKRTTTTTVNSTNTSSTNDWAEGSVVSPTSIPHYDNAGYTAVYMNNYETTTDDVRWTVPNYIGNDETVSGSWNGSVLTETNGKITWIFDSSTGEMRIEGSGSIPYRNLNYGNFSALNKIIIGEGITGIDPHCFRDIYNLTDVVLSDSVETIGEYAFVNCTSLKNITFGKNLVSLGRRAFENCTSLEKAELPDSLEKIEFSTFAYCRNLESVIFGENIKEIEKAAFDYCSKLKEISIPDSVESIGLRAFYGCTSLANVQFGNGLKTIKESAFETCIALYEISIPDSVETIEVNAFKDCLNLKKISIGNGIKSIGRQAFGNTAYYLNEDNWEDGVLYIDNCLIKAADWIDSDYRIKEGTRVLAGYAFSNVWNLNSIYIPEGVVGIGNGAFANVRLNQLDIPESVEIIGPLAFSSSKLNTELEISENLKEIGAGAFWDSGISRFTVDENNPYLMNDEYGVVYTKDMKKLVIFPDECTVTDYTVKDGTEEIGDFAFVRSNLKNISIPETVEKIGYAAFAGSWELEELVIPDKVKKLERYLVWGTGHLKLFDTGDGVETLYGNIFSSWSTIDCMKIGKSVRYNVTLDAEVKKYIVDPENPYFSSDDYGALYSKNMRTLIRFPGGSSVEDYVMPIDVVHMYADAFSSSENLKSITFSINFGTDIEPFQRNGFEINTEKFIVPEGNDCLSTDENGVLFNKDKTVLIAYPQNSKETSYVVPDSVETIENYAFFESKNLAEISLPEKPMHIYSNSFAGCGVQNNKDNYEDGCFYVGNHLIEITAYIYQPKILRIREGTIDIATTYSFSGSTELIVGIYIPKSLEYISEHTFWWAYNLQNVYYPGTQAEWEAIDIVYHGNELLWDAVINCYATDIPTVTDPVPVIETIKDEKTGVSIEIDTSKYDSPVKILVEENIEDKSAFDIITTQVDVDGFALYDIKIAVDGVYIQPKDTVTVRLPLPRGFDASRSMVFYVNTENGEVERMNARFENGYMVFETNHFSYYAIVEAEAKPVPNPQPVVSFNHGNISLFYKHSTSVSATASKGKVVYSSSDPDVVSVDANGNITANKVGSAVITATIEGTNVSASCNVTVKYAWWQWIINILLLGFLWY